MIFVVTILEECWAKAKKNDNEFLHEKLFALCYASCSIMPIFGNSNIASIFSIL